MSRVCSQLKQLVLVAVNSSSAAEREPHLYHEFCTATSGTCYVPYTNTQLENGRMALRVKCF